MFGITRISRGIGMGIFKRNFSAPVAPFASHVAPDGDGGGAKPSDLPDPQQPAAAGRARKSAAKLAAEGGVAKSGCFFEDGVIWGIKRLTWYYFRSYRGCRVCIVVARGEISGRFQGIVRDC